MEMDLARSARGPVLFRSRPAELDSDPNLGCTRTFPALPPRTGHGELSSARLPGVLLSDRELSILGRPFVVREPVLHLAASDLHRGPDGVGGCFRKYVDAYPDRIHRCVRCDCALHRLEPGIYL